MPFTTNIRTVYTAEHIVTFDNRKQQIILSFNSGKLNFSAVSFFIIGAIFSSMLLPHLAKNVWLTLIAFAFFSLPFLLFAFRYFIMSRSKKEIIIDIRKQSILYSSKLQIPFRSIKQIYLTQINYYDPEQAGKYFFTMRKIPSWQLTIDDYSGNSIILCKPENKSTAKQLLEDISKGMNVEIKKGIEIL